MIARQKAFTLIEMLLALAIFAYGASAIIDTLGQSARNLSQLKTLTFASIVADNRIADLYTDTKWPPANNAKGEEEQAGQTWFWQQQVIETGDPNFRMVTVSVYDDASRKNSVYQLSVYLANLGTKKP